MTEPPDSTAAPTERLGRPPRFVVGVVLIVLLVAAAWSAIWYIGTRKGEEMMSAWLAAEAEKGRTYHCAERGTGGYPFRVEVSCLSPELDIADAVPHVRARAGAFRAVAQVWNLTHVIFEIDGPARIETGDRRRTPDFAIEADWELLQGSLRAPGGGIARADISVTGLTATPDSTTPGATLSAQRVEVHGRHSEDAAARDYDVALDADGLVVAIDGVNPPEPVDVGFVGRLAALPYPPPRDPAAFIAAWREAGGAVDVARLSAVEGDTEIRAEGKLVPDAAGRPEGTVTIRLAGPDVDTPGAAGAFGGLAPMIALALRLTGEPSEIDGRSALSGRIDLKDGQVLLGPMPLATLPGLF